MLGARYDVYDPDVDASEQQGPAVVPRDRTYTTLALMGLVALRRRAGSPSSTTTTRTRSAGR